MRSFSLMMKALLAVGCYQAALFAAPKNVLHLYGFGERPSGAAQRPFVELLDELSEEHKFTLTHAKTSDIVDSIDKYDVVLFNSVAFGAFTKPAEQEKLIEWITGGGKAIGFNSTCDVRGKWDWWGDVMCSGSWYDDDFFGAFTLELDPEIEKNPALKTAWNANNLGNQINFPKTELFVFNSNPRGKEGVTMLLTVKQEDTDIPDHPFAWHKKVEKGEFIYAALGHQGSDFDNGWIKKATWAWIQYFTGDYNAAGVVERQNAPFVRLEMGKHRLHIKEGGRHWVRLFDLQGRICGQWSGRGEMTYPLRGLKTGIYYLRVKSGHLDYMHPVTIL